MRQAWYVGTLARYTVVHGAGEATARKIGGLLFGAALKTVRPATADEVRLDDWTRRKEKEEKTSNRG